MDERIAQKQKYNKGIKTAYIWEEMDWYEDTMDEGVAV